MYNTASKHCIQLQASTRMYYLIISMGLASSMWFHVGWGLMFHHHHADIDHDHDADVHDGDDHDDADDGHGHGGHSQDDADAVGGVPV